MFTPVQLDKMRNFRYGMRALHNIEKTLKTKISKLDFDELSQYEIAVIVWAGLEHEDKSLNPEIVMDLIDQHSNLSTIAQKMSEAFSASFTNGNDTGKTLAATEK